MSKEINRGNTRFIVKCTPNHDSLSVTIPKKQIVDYYKLKRGDWIVLDFIKKVNMGEENEK